MNNCDVILKLLISGSAESTLRLLGAGPVSKWLNVELPKVQNQRVDLLAELASRELLHIELQSTNVADMPQRMLEYGTAIWRVQGAFPRQIVLFVGNDRLRMSNGFCHAGINFQYDLVDIRHLDGEALLASDCTSDNILALLTSIKRKAEAVHGIFGKIGRLEPGKREDALRKPLLICGMRGLEGPFDQEKNKMPVMFDIMDNKILGPAIRQGIEQGRKEGREEGQKATEEIVRRQVEKRFGPLPQWADQRFHAFSPSQIADLALKLLDAKSLEELFG